MEFGERVRSVHDRRASERKAVAEEADRWRQRRAEHSARAASLLPEVQEAVAVLQRRREQSLALLQPGRRGIFVLWGDQDGVPLARIAGEARKEKRARKRRRAIGWEIWTDGAPRSKRADKVVILLDGSVFVKTQAGREKRSRLGLGYLSLQDYADGGYWYWSGDKVDVEDCADLTLEAALEKVAMHIADLDEAMTEEKTRRPRER